MKTPVNAQLAKTLDAISKKVAAVKALRQETIADLDAVIAEAERLKSALGDINVTIGPIKKPVVSQRRILSPDGRERIAKAARDRWAAYRKAKTRKVAKSKAPIKKAKVRKFSTKGKLAISAGMRKYWARRKKFAAVAEKGKVLDMTTRTGTGG